ncbi:MAG: hypothetical protein EBY39_13750 [Flavobacteriia bacterium]|jgi:hypothetical protein|nr:hypothetical protein [Flavobacteriia bacterium]
MKTFQQFEKENSESPDLSEAMTMAQRMKMKQAFKRNRAKIMLGRKKAAKKLASPEKLKLRANKQAREILIKKILKDKNKADLSFSGRQALEKKIDKKKAAIAKIAKKLLPGIKLKDREKLKKNSNAPMGQG